MNWLRRMFGKPDPAVEQKFAAAHARSDQVIAKTQAVLKEASRLEVMRNSARRAGQRMTR